MEQGAREIRVASNIDRRPLIVVSDKLISSTCEVVKR